MSAIERTTKHQVDELREGVKNMSVDMRMFSLTMRSLYAEKAVGTNENAAKKFRKLRNDTRNDAMVYIKGILPLTTEFISSISSYFEFFEALTFDEWCENISMIRKQVSEYKKLSNTLLKMHKELLAPLKKRRDQASLLLNEMTHLVGNFEEKRARLERRAGIKRTWAIILLFFPFIGTIANIILNAEIDKDLAEAIAAGKQAEVEGAAAWAVEGTLIPAFKAFIGGISKAAGFFSVMEHELITFENNAKESEDDPRFFFFTVMKVEAKDMKSICRVFYQALPDIETDFQALPIEGTDLNYVDGWLEKQKKIIKEECKGKLSQKLLEVIAYALKTKMLFPNSQVNI